MKQAFETDEAARMAALSLHIHCQFGNKNCPNTPVCDCPALSTPPVVNSNPARVPPSGADGQGACTQLYSLTYRENSGPACGAVTTECDLWASNAVILLRSLLGRGVESVTVEVQL